MNPAEELAKIRVIVIANGIPGGPSVHDMVVSMVAEKEATINRVGAVSGLVGIEHERTAEMAEDLAVLIEGGASAQSIATQIARGRAHRAQSRKPGQGGQ